MTTYSDPTSHRILRSATTTLAITALLAIGAGLSRTAHAQPGGAHAVFLPLASNAAESLGDDSGAALGGTWTSYVDSNAIMDLTLDRGTGDVWAATEGGAIRWDPATGTYTRFSTQDGLALNRVIMMAVDEEGGRWFFQYPEIERPVRPPATLSRLSRDGEWRAWTVPGTIMMSYELLMVARADGTVWLDTAADGVMRRDPDNTWHAEPDAGCGSIHAMALDDLGAPWFASECGVRRLGPGRQWEGWLDGKPIFSIALVDGRDEAWFGGLRTAYHVRPIGEMEIVELPLDVLPEQAEYLVEAIAAGADGAVWMRTDGVLARRGSDGLWRRWDESDGLVEMGENRMVVDAGGDAWLMTRRGGSVRKLLRISADGTIRSQRSALGPVGYYFVAVHVDRAGDRWFGSTYGGLSRFTRDGRWESSFGLADRPEESAANSVIDIAEDASGNLWVGTASGFRRTRSIACRSRPASTSPSAAALPGPRAASLCSRGSQCPSSRPTRQAPRPSRARSCGSAGGRG